MTTRQDPLYVEDAFGRKSASVVVSRSRPEAHAVRALYEAYRKLKNESLTSFGAKIDVLFRSPSESARVDTALKMAGNVKTILNEKTGLAFTGTTARVEKSDERSFVITLSWLECPPEVESRYRGSTAWRAY